MFKKVLVTSKHDFDAEQIAFQRALKLCGHQDVELEVLIVLPEINKNFDLARWQYSAEDIAEKLASNTRERVTRLLKECGLQDKSTCTVEFGKLYLNTIQHVQKNGHDLVLKVAESPGWLAHLFDSDDMHLIRKCPVPIWIMDDTKPQHLKRVAVAVDFDQGSSAEGDVSVFNTALTDFALFIAKMDGAHLDIIHIFDTGFTDFASMWADDRDKVEAQMLHDAQLESESAMADLYARVKSKMAASDHRESSPNITVKTHLQQGSAEYQIPEMVKTLESDLLVMGTVGRTGIKGLIIGNTAESVMIQLKTSVFAIKPKGFRSPVEIDN